MKELRLRVARSALRVENRGPDSRFIGVGDLKWISPLKRLNEWRDSLDKMIDWIE